uniref:N-acetyltransferase domain-containing protein n=1 Tax=Corethron hystrix TaxID=216773 RepID=A0A7S1B307_9STRA|mmetsp:Transcript_10863/g.23861  ORF Transcript_10863/g.23861 Transcript_10863/m.23861 type:complete len:194 (+) Transcript_10863:131-712(+)
MTTIRRFRMTDLFRFNSVNLDVLTATYAMPFYFDYFSRHPEYFEASLSPHTNSVTGYVMGKAEGHEKSYHGHVTAVTVAPPYRRLGLAHAFMDSLETISSDVYNAYFVDLFVRESNATAIGMYRRFGYGTYRRVLGYYSGGCGPTVVDDDGAVRGLLPEDEDGLDMRKALSRDAEGETVVPLGRPVRPEDLEW